MRLPILVAVTLCSACTDASQKPEALRLAAGQPELATAPFSPADPAGSLDSTFAEGGVATFDSTAIDLGKAAIVQKGSFGDRILVAGKSGGRTTDFILVRFDPRGGLDGSFGPGGRGWVTTDFGEGANDEGKSLAIQPDGRIVLGGITTRAGDGRFGVARYNKRGRPDETFGSEEAPDSGDALGIPGIANANFTTGNDEGKAVALQPCGPDPAAPSEVCIVMVGKAEVQAEPGMEEVTGDIALARWTSAGVLDESFGGEDRFAKGRVTTNIDDIDEGNSLRVLPDGKLLVGGQAGPRDAASALVMRYERDGKLDDTFGTSGGYTLISIPGAINTLSFGLTTDDGNILLAGVTFDAYGESDMIVVRTDSDGFPDDSFGDDGVRVLFDSAYADQATSVAVQADGKIVVAGKSTFRGAIKDEVASWFSLARLDTFGADDESFGDGGRALLSPFVTSEASTDGDDGAYALVIQRNGKILAIGESFNGNDDDIAVLRILP